MDTSDDPALTPAEVWTVVDHACRGCGGRVLRRGDIFRCSSCEAESKGNPTGICGCGMAGPDGKLGFRCKRNPARTLASRVAVVIAYEGSES